MALMEEREVSNSSGIYEQCKLEELTPENGSSIGFYLVDTPMIEGDDGEFMVCHGLQVDLTVGSIDELVKSAEPVSFIPKSILQQAIQDEEWNIGQIARLENVNRPGDLNKKGKKTRYFAWKIFIQNAPNDLLKQLKDKVAKLKEESPEDMEPAADTPKPKI